MDFVHSLDLLRRHLRQDVTYAVVSDRQKFVLEFGRPFIGVKRPKGVRLGRQKQCFMNATQAICGRDAEPSKDPSYVEGFAMVPGTMPIHHAWITLNGEHAVELTLKHNPLEIAFFGIPFSRRETIQLLKGQEVYGFLQVPIRAAIYDLVQQKMSRSNSNR